MKFSIVLIFLISLFTCSVHAKTTYVKYKNYLIPVQTTAYNECPSGAKPKIIITTDIGAPDGSTVSDDDDIQSMIHFLVSSDRLDTKGLISSPPGTGRASHIDAVLSEYQKDLPELGASYPSFLQLDGVVRQGLLSTINQNTPPSLSATLTEHSGARLIRDEALKILSRSECGPLYVLVWGAISDLALALHDSPEIAGVLRVYMIASFNDQGDPESFHLHQG